MNSPELGGKAELFGGSGSFGGERTYKIRIFDDRSSSLAGRRYPGKVMKGYR